MNVIVPENAVLRASKWCYRGVWAGLTRWLKVPEQPPSIRGADDEWTRGFRPAEGFLKYLKFFFWLGLVAFDGILFLLWIILLISVPWLGILLAVPIWFIMIVPDILAYIAIHLRYDTTWYVLTDRSMRIRRGLWIIKETTITYDNIQNVSIRQGPLQRYYGISNVIVETAGGGGGESGGHGEMSSNSHVGLLEGIDNASEVRELIMSKWQASRSSGLGDESAQQGGSNGRTQVSGAYSEGQVQLLEEIRELATQLAAD